MKFEFRSKLGKLMEFSVDVLNRETVQEPGGKRFEVDGDDVYLVGSYRNWTEQGWQPGPLIEFGRVYMGRLVGNG